MIKFHMRQLYRDLEKKFKIPKSRIRKEYNRLKPSISTNKISADNFWSMLSKRLELDAASLRGEWLSSLKRNDIINREVVKIVNNSKRNGCRVAALSNTIGPHEKVHRKMGRYKFFSRVFLSNRLGMEKPDVRIYRYVATQLKVKTSECVFIDDKPENINGARKAGMKGIVFKNASRLEKDLKKYL